MDTSKRAALCMLTAAAVASLAACSSGNSASYQAQNETTGYMQTYSNDTAAEYCEAQTEAQHYTYSENRESYKNDDVNTEEYTKSEESGFLSVKQRPLSTFSADVDTASYTMIRRMIEEGRSVPEDAVRIEEILNYFDYTYPDPVGNEPFSVTAELSSCPWNEENELLLVGVQAKKEYEQGEHIPKNLVFLIDVSGSMYSPDKLPLVQQAFTMLTNELDGTDRISVVTYAGSDEVLLNGETGDNKEKIKQVIGSLSAGGSTAGAAGIKTAYEIAEKNFISGGNNRILLATDGDLNVGVSSVDGLTKLVEEERDKGVYLSVLGFGSGNYKDNRLEAIADNGNGNYSYIDCLSEAKKVLVDEMDSTLTTVAKDVKFQVEFNPSNVVAYRLIGYENRQLADKDFEDDTKDAGEVGAGHSVTVLYEIVPVNSRPHADEEYTPSFRYSGNTENYNTENVLLSKEEANILTGNDLSGELLTVSIRCKEPGSDTSKLYTYPVGMDRFTYECPENLNFAACCAEFGMLLKNSEYKGTADYDQLKMLMERYDYSHDDYRSEFAYLVNAASSR